MAVAPISFGSPQISQPIDFASMGQQLLQNYQQAQKRAILDQVAQGGGNPQDLIRGGLQTGDIGFANLGQSILNRQQEQQRQAAQDAYQREKDARSFGLQEKQMAQTAAYQRGMLENAQDYSPEELTARREAMLKAARIDPNSPQGQAFMLTEQYDPGASRAKLPPGFEYAPDGSLRPIKGGPADYEYMRGKPDKQNAPSGYVWNDPSDPSKGMSAIPGGPGEKVDAEVAARLGLAKSFLGQLPGLKERVQRGDATGLFDAAKAYAGIGEPGQIRRQMDSGAEALLRMLTGAGMNKEEAADYTRRYKLSPTDSSATVLDKLSQLERELNSVGETVGRGRGGWDSLQKPTAPTKPGGVVDYRTYFGN